VNGVSPDYQASPSLGKSAVDLKQLAHRGTNGFGAAVSDQRKKDECSLKTTSDEGETCP